MNTDRDKGLGQKTKSPAAASLRGTPSEKTAATYSPTVTQYHRRDRA